MINDKINLVVMFRHGTDDMVYVSEVSNRIHDMFVDQSVKVDTHTTCIAGCKSMLHGNENYQTVVVAIGGDGTFATACRMFGDEKNLIVGVSGGNLNFLTPFAGLDELHKLFLFSAKVSHRSLGQFIVNDYEETIEAFANDVVIQPCESGRMVNVTVNDGQGRFIMSYRGDGLIISTSMGSTAYNLSAGGPLIHPTMDAFVITPKYPVHMAARPLVMPVGYGLQVIVDTDVDIIHDGLLQHSMGHHTDVLNISRGNAVNIALPVDYSYFDQVRAKLGWFK